MKLTQEQKQKVKEKMVAAAGRGFKKKGYGGLGVDGLAKEAGMTSGAFYGHFSSKEEAFKEVINQGLSDYVKAINAFEQEHGKEWFSFFLDYYLGKEHRMGLDESCAVPALSAEVVRSTPEIKEVFAEGIKEVAKNMSGGLENNDEGDALALIALLAGTLLLSRSVADEQLAEEISSSARKWAEKIVCGE